MATITESIMEQAAAYQLSPQLIAALIQTESSGIICAARYEPKFFYKYIASVPTETLGGHWPNPCRVSEETERTFRAMSLGLMQTMGQRVRECGYEGDYLAYFLQEPALSIHYGCMILSQCMNKAKGNLQKALLFYNGGGNKKYPEVVIRNLDSGAGHYLLMNGRTNVFPGGLTQ